MFVYEKRLQYPINIKTTNPKLAKIIITQYGGPKGQRLLFLNITISFSSGRQKIIFSITEEKRAVFFVKDILLSFNKLLKNSFGV